MTHTTFNPVAANVRAGIAYKNVHHKQLRTKLDLSQQAFSRRNNGQIEWKATEVAKLAELLGYSTDQLLNGLVSLMLKISTKTKDLTRCLTKQLVNYTKQVL